jgi:hypothetical protein
MQTMAATLLAVERGRGVRGGWGNGQAEVGAAREEVAAMKKKLEGALARKVGVENECRR